MSRLAQTHRRLLRVCAWIGIPVLVALRIAVAVTVEDPVAEFLWADVLTYLGPMLVAAIMCAVLTVRYKLIEQRFWGLLAAACACMLVAESYWDWYAVTVDYKGPGFEGPYKYFAVIAAALFCILLVSMTRVGDTRSPRRFRFYLDLAAAMVVGYTVVYVNWTLPSLAGFEGHVTLAAWSAAWPVLGVTMLCILVAIMVGYKAFLWRSWERLTATSHALFAVGLVSFPIFYPQLLSSTALEASWYTLVLGAGLYLLFIAGVYRVTEDDEGALARAWPVPSYGRESLRRAYPLALVLSLPVIGLTAASLSVSGEEGPLVGASVVLAFILGLRSWMLVLEVAQHRTRAVTDPLTGAFTRAYLLERLGAAATDGETSDMTGWLVILRVNDFSRLDEMFGRVAGDAVLRKCVAAMSAEGAAGTEVFRVGGSEFLAILRDGDEAVALSYVARVNDRLRDVAAGPVPPFAVSCGLARPSSDDADWQAVLERAQSAAEIAAYTDERVRVFRDGDDDNLIVDGESRPLQLRAAMLALAEAGDARDDAAPDHGARVSRLGVALARYIGLDANQVELVRVSGLLHDIGKIGVSSSVLSRPGALSAGERAAVERHCELGERLVLAAGLGAIARIVRHHHERWDGGGYPDGVAGKHIPLESRVLAVCDTLETLTSLRAYRSTLTVDQALEEIESCAGRQFDPTMSAALCALIRESEVPPVEFHPVVLPEGEACAS